MSQSWKRYLIPLCVGALVYLVFLFGLLQYRAHSEVVKARDFISQGDLAAADRHYFQALNWYAPVGASQKAADELMALAMENMEAGRKYEAYQSLLRLRGALLAARSFYTPRKDLLVKADELISLYLAQTKLGPGADKSMVRELARIYGSLYSSWNKQGESWYFFAVLGFLLWVWASFWIIRSLFGPASLGKLTSRLRKAVIPLSIFVYGYILWLFSMSIA
jgi:hypothetical protein